jgi:hypothetical protein
MNVDNGQKHTRWVYALPMAHLCTCLIGIAGTLAPRVSVLAFAWSLVFFVDFPISIVPLILAWKFPFLAALWLLVAGTLWWYLLSLGVRRLVREIRGG